MIICGIKLTHDGSMALIDGNRLAFSYEMEKLNNNERYSTFNLELEAVNQLMGEYANRIDQIVFDGWTPEQPVTINLGKGEVPIELAGYGSYTPTKDMLERKSFVLPGEAALAYSSYQHVTGHITSAYCTSPFAKNGEDAYVLIWDGGMFPQLFLYHHSTNKIETHGLLFLLAGNVYGVFAQRFGPFRQTLGRHNSELSVPGKLMAYIALGNYREEIIPIFESVLFGIDKNNFNFAGQFADLTAAKLSGGPFSDEDILTTFHVYIEKMIVDRLVGLINRRGQKSENLCVAGGCALNIKWNSAIRNTGLFKEVWVPPFPNDAGSAIGTACCEMIRTTGINALDWNVYAGPAVIQNFSDKAWVSRLADIKELAILLYEKNEPVVFIDGRAELGPRALGNRSILAPAAEKGMKRILNRIKDREDYRPVAPICLEEDAPTIFNPGIRDPYMLFDHEVRPQWLDRVPAICHLDNTARLQTVGPDDNPTIYKLLTEYKRISGIPLLCNTSANYNGKGFFPDIASVIGWGQVNYIWSDGMLYEKEVKTRFRELEELVQQY